MTSSDDRSRLRGRMGSLLAELKRRKVYQVSAIYVIVAIGALEFADVLVPSTRLPDWTDEFLVVLLIAGLPLVIVLAWLFDITPGGVRRTPDLAPSSGESARSTATAQIDDESARLERLAVAVLPFENLSGAADAEPFAAGLHDDLLTELSRISALTVISRTSVRGYRGTDKTIPQIARELGVGTIVEGGVQQAGNRVRLNVQLIDARTDVHLWAERYDRELAAESIFDLQAELASRIMTALEAELTPVEEARPSALPAGDLEAYRHYATGREFFVDRSEGALRQAAHHFEQAVERDPGYALAWAGLANARVMLVEYGFEHSDSLLAEGEAAARRALDLVPTLPEAHSALGNVHCARLEGGAALEAQQRAVEFGPSYAGAHQWLCWVNLLMGRPQAALDAGRRAVRLAPHDPEARGNLAIALLGVGEAEEARAEAGRVLSRHADFTYAQWAAALADFRLGSDDLALSALQRVSGGWAAAWPATARGLGLAARGEDAEARKVLEELRGEDSQAFYAGILHAALGERDDAFAAVHAATPLAWDQLLFFRYHRGAPLDSLVEDPRFERLMRALDRTWGA